MVSNKRNIIFFNINNFDQGIRRQLTEGIVARIFPGQQAMLSLVKIEPNAQGKLHSHVQEQWGFLIEGSIKRVQDGLTVEVFKGDFWRTPSGVEHGVIGGPNGALILDIFAPPRPEYSRQGTGFD